MTDRQKVKNFLVALSKDDYVEANKLFPDVVKSSVKSLINKRKEDVINDINAKASELVSSSVLEKEPEEKEKKPEEGN